MNQVEQFCQTHDACEEGRKWAIANCQTMQEAWDNAPDPRWVVWIATRPGVLTDRELRLFAVWCARQVQHLMTDQRSLDALDVAERHANGQATDEELSAARDAAWAAWAAWDSARAAARTAARTTSDAAWAAAQDSAGDAARAAQADYLRKNATPTFS